MLANNFNINPDKIYVYIRVSTKSQAFQQNGLKDQEKICYDYVNKYYKHIPTELYSEIGSSYNNKNKLYMLEKIMRKMTSNSLIIVRDISRLGRDTFQVFSLLRKIKQTNSYIIGINENLCYNYSRLTDREFSHIIIDSEKSSDYKHIKTTKHNIKIKSQGGWIGRNPYGTMIVKHGSIPHIYKNPNEIKIITTMGIDFIKCKNISGIADKLNSKKIFKKNGRMWTVNTVKYMLKKHYPSIFESKNKKKNIKYLSNIIINTVIFPEIPNLSYVTNETNETNKTNETN